MYDLFNDGFFTGINYWGSKSAINMWSEFDPESIEGDLKLMRDAGITHLRVFPLWSVFQPLCALYTKSIYEFTFGEVPIPDTPAGRAGVSEEACERFGVFCRLCEKYGMKLIVALITGHMSFRTYNPPAFDGKALLSDPTVIKWQIRFVKYFVSRFKDQSSIVAWDLGNEPSNMPGLNDNPDTFYVWCSTIADAARSCDGSRPIISGIHKSNVETGPSNLKMVGEVCDIHTTHPYQIFETSTSPLATMIPILDLPFKCRLGEDISGIPTFVQEFGSIGYMNCSKKTEADFYRASLLTTLAHGCHGVMWWCAFDQGHLDYAPYRWNTIGSQYGFFDKDLREKPIVRENRLFGQLLDSLPDRKLPPPKTDGVILIPREEKPDIDLLRTSYALAKKAGLNMGFYYLLDKIPKSPLYIIPSVKHNKAIPKNRLDELMERVREGSVLYLCVDSGILRDVPEITGVEIAYRQKVSAARTLCMSGKELPIKSNYYFSIESADAEVIGKDERGMGVLFKHAYGKGTVYFMTLPLESYLTESSETFHSPDAPDYSIVYKELARAANVKKACDSDNPFVLLTEHWIDESTAYILAINYHNTPMRASITFGNACEVRTVYGAPLENGALHLGANDGALMLLTKL